MKSQRGASATPSFSGSMPTSRPLPLIKQSVTLLDATPRWLLGRRTLSYARATVSKSPGVYITTGGVSRITASYVAWPAPGPCQCVIACATARNLNSLLFLDGSLEVCINCRSCSCRTSLSQLSCMARRKLSFIYCYRRGRVIETRPFYTVKSMSFAADLHTILA